MRKRHPYWTRVRNFMYVSKNARFSPYCGLKYSSTSDSQNFSCGRSEAFRYLKKILNGNFQEKINIQQRDRRSGKDASKKPHTQFTLFTLPLRRRVLFLKALLKQITNILNTKNISFKINSLNKKLFFFYF